MRQNIGIIQYIECIYVLLTSSAVRKSTVFGLR